MPCVGDLYLVIQHVVIQPHEMAGDDNVGLAAECDKIVMELRQGSGGRPTS